MTTGLDLRLFPSVKQKAEKEKASGEAVKTDHLNGDVEDTHKELLTDLASRLDQYWKRIANEPQFNPVKQLAFELSRELEAGRLSLDDFSSMIKILSDRALLSRANTMRSYIGEANIEDASDDLIRFRGLVHEVAHEKGQLIPFEAFKAELERPRKGVVFTAHPTFSMSQEMRAFLIELIETPSKALDAEFKERLTQLDHRPDPDLNLSSEQAQAQVALKNAGSARREFHKIILEEARRLYPARWTEITPSFFNLNSWVGYDLDGRTDIRWYDSLCFRLKEKRDQLELHSSSIETSLYKLAEDEQVPASHLQSAYKMIRHEIEALEHSLHLFAVDDLTPGEVSKAANFLTGDVRQDGSPKQAGIFGGAKDNERPLRSSLGSVIDLIQKAIEACSEKETLFVLTELKTELLSAGLTTSHIHIRINAMQLHNAIRKPLGGGAVDVSSLVSLSKLDEMILNDETESVNFKCLALERSTAVRQFIVIAQILKFIDGDAPIRLLIAECEHSLTVLSALYFAKLFGLEERVDVSPLFETERAMERGAEIIKSLLKLKSYRDYVLKRGRISIQTGFSDAGRFMGQIPATLAIEKLQRRIASILNNADLGHIEVLIFNTHGESMGRGAHPSTLKDRFDYVLTPYVRNAYNEKDLRLHHEVSFQGGDGYVFFGSETLAKATLSEFARSHLIEGGHFSDVLYDNPDFNEDLFEHVKTYQTKLFENKDYQSSLGALETNLLFKTGSRKTKRQFDGRQDNRVAAAKMRAIPHNGVLQQFGFLANVISGFGTALLYDKEQFANIYQNSERARSLIGMIARARQLSSVKTLVAYASIFNDAFWVTRPIENMESPLKRPCLLLAGLLRGDERHDRFMHLATYLREDDIYLHDLFKELGLDEWQSQADGHERDEVIESDMLHALRIALIMHIYLLGGRLPILAARNDLTHKDIMRMVLSLRIDDALTPLREAYPRAKPTRAEYEIAEEASYMVDEGSDFEELNDRLIDPMVESYELIRRVGVGIGHHFRAYG
ncbi:MAG: phosphoenolpyruvate carboxylase [Rhizobiales bacterium]|nr:phosphoenolpyruvate carboxylase [Hyphomicrobiales bacterium]